MSKFTLMKIRLYLAAAVLGCSLARGADLRLGIIGCDTSHVTAFTEALNNPEAKGHVAGAKVVAAFKGGSKDIPRAVRGSRSTRKRCRKSME
jgi:hypothetical protein